MVATWSLSLPGSLLVCTMLTACNDSNSQSAQRSVSPTFGTPIVNAGNENGTEIPANLNDRTEALESPIGKSDTAVTVLDNKAAPDVSYTISPAATDRTFDGIGGVADSAQLLYFYPEPQRSQILDYLFKPKYGLAAQVLKLEIGGDTNSTVGAESSPQHAKDGPFNVNNGYEMWLAQEARKRNPDIKLWGLQWGAPGWLKSICSKDDADYVVKWVEGLRDLNLLPDYISAGQNERSCAVYPGWLSDTENIKTLRKALNDANLQSVKIIGYERTDKPTLSSFDDMAQKALYAVGLHYPGGWQFPLSWGATSTEYQDWGRHGIKYWAAEDTDFQSIKPPGTLTRQYNLRYIQDGVSLIMDWTIIGATYSTYNFLRDTGLNPNKDAWSKPQMPLYATEPWSGHYELVEAPFWAMAHTTQFTKPGWHYIQSAIGTFGAGSNVNGSIVTYADSDKAQSDWTSTIETMGATTAQTIRVVPGAGLANSVISIFTSNDKSKIYFNDLGTFSLPQEGLTLKVEPNSLVTISTSTGRHKGDDVKTAPASAPFPAQYADDFESNSVGETNAKYFAPQNGAYEVQACGGGRTGKCMVQVAPMQPIDWPNDPDRRHDPFTLIGDQMSVDGTVEADVLLPDTNAATYAGIGGHNQFQRSVDQCYKLRLYGNGTWELARTGTDADTRLTKLKTGNYSAGASPKWHKLKLTFAGGTTNPTISAAIDGDVVADAIAVPDKSIFSFGQPVLLSNYSAVQYDNISLTSSTFAVPYGVTGNGLNQWTFSGDWSSNRDNTWTNATSASATFKFKGASTVVYNAAANGSNGIASVSLDNGPPKLVDLYSSAPATQSVLTLPGLDPSKEHTLTITPSGTKNSAASGTFVSIASVTLSRD